MRISSEYSGRTQRRSVTSLSENRQLPRRSAPGIIAAEVHAMNEVATTFLTLGAVSYGGAGILGMMQAEIQQKRGWFSKERFRARSRARSLTARSGRCQWCLTRTVVIIDARRSRAMSVDNMNGLLRSPRPHDTVREKCGLILPERKRRSK